MSFSFPGDAPTLHSGRCLNQRHAGAQCTRCVDACPVEAVTRSGPTPVLNDSACVRCGICTHSCPTDAFEQSRTMEQRLAQTAAQLPQDALALVCPIHPAPSETAAAVAAIVQHRRCLAALSVSDLLEISAGGARALWLDDAPCVACPIGAAQTTLRINVSAARALLRAAGCRPAIVLHSEQPSSSAAQPQRRPLIDGGQPTMSRRALFARLRPRQQPDQVETPLEEWVQRGAPLSARLPQQTPDSRRRLLAALAALGVAEAGDLPTQRTPFAAVQVDEGRCSACALCARFCPTAALHFEQQADAFTLTFQPAACVDCGICVVACPEDAVSLGDRVSLATILADDLIRLAAGALVSCASCGARTASLAGEVAPRCHVCRHGAGVVTSLRDEAGLMADLLKRTKK